MNDSSNVLTTKQSRYPKDDEHLRPSFERERIEVPGSPRAVLRAALEGGDLSPVEVAAVAGAARVAKCPARVRDPLREGRLDAARNELRTWLRPPEARSRLDVEVALWRARDRAAKCSTTYRVYKEAGHGLHAVEHRCRARVCVTCARRAMRAALSRWRVLFAAPVRAGYVASFVTLTPPVAVAETGDDVRKLLRAVSRFADMLRRGRPSWGIPARSWVAGVRSLELVPRVNGGFAHVHMLVVRRAFVPFGLHAAKLREVAPHDVRPAHYGMRACARAAGLGEVLDVQDVTTEADADGATAVEVYMAKVEAYMAKVEGKTGKGKAPGTWEGRDDLQRAMRGRRLVEGFGDARGLFGGPDEVRRVRAGVPCGEWSLVGTYDPADPDTWDVLPTGAAMLDGADLTITRRTTYRTDTLERWRAWCDVDRLRERMRIVA